MSIGWKRGAERRGGLAVLAAALGLLALGPAPARAQQTPLETLAQDTASDRMDRLVAGAKQEGTVTVYTSAPVEDMTVLADAFQKKYGVKVNLWRASSEDVLRRGIAETGAGRYEVDVLETNGPELEALWREKVVAPVKSPTFTELLPSAVPAHNGWVGTRLNVITAAYNTGIVGEDEKPKAWTDFLNPEWKGKLGVEAEDFDWFASIVKSFPSEQEGLDFFRKLVATNGVSIRKGHTLMTNLVAAGEVPMAMTVYEYKAEQLKNDGAPLDWFGLSPTPARVNGISVARHAPHPNAALLFYEFEMTDAQDLLAKRGFTATNVKRVPLPGKLDIEVIDSALVLDEGNKWRDLFKQIILTAAQ